MNFLHYLQKRVREHFGNQLLHIIWEDRDVALDMPQIRYGLPLTTWNAIPRHEPVTRIQRDELLLDRRETLEFVGEDVLTAMAAVKLCRWR